MMLRLLVVFSLSLLCGEMIVLLLSGKLSLYESVVSGCFVVIILVFLFVRRTYAKLLSYFSIALSLYGLVVFFVYDGERARFLSVTQRQLESLAKPVEQYVRKHNECPASFEMMGLNSSDYVDMFTAGASVLNISSDADRCLLYSVGFDRIDDSGLHVMKNNAISDDWHSSILRASILGRIFRSRFSAASLDGDFVVEVTK